MRRPTKSLYRSTTLLRLLGSLQEAFPDCMRSFGLSFIQERQTTSACVRIVSEKCFPRDPNTPHDQMPRLLKSLGLLGSSWFPLRSPLIFTQRCILDSISSRPMSASLWPIHSVCYGQWQLRKTPQILGFFSRHIIYIYLPCVAGSRSEESRV